MPDGSNNGDKRRFGKQAYRLAERRIEDLEKLADNLWPGKDVEARNLRAYNVWLQINRETDWDEVEFCPYDHDPDLPEPHEIVDILASDLEPHIGRDATGFGDHLRAELRRQGSNLETLFLSNRLGKEFIPWDVMTKSVYSKTQGERQELRREFLTKIPYIWKRY